MVLGDDVHNPHCAGRLEKILLLCIQEKLLSSDMDKICAERDKVKKEGTQKVLTMLWALAKQDDTRCGLALSAHVKILQLFCKREKRWKVGKEQ